MNSTIDVPYGAFNCPIHIANVSSIYSHSAIFTHFMLAVAIFSHLHVAD